MADHEVGGLYPIDLASDVDDDEDSGKAIWDDLASEIGGGAATVDTPATEGVAVADLVTGAAKGEDVSYERTSTLDEKVPIEVADMHFSQDIQSKAEIQPACGTLKEQPSKAVYGSCISGQMFGLQDSQYILAKPSSSERFYNHNSDAIGSNHLKLHRQISADGNAESRSELNKDAIGVLSGEKSPLAKSGKQIEQLMVNDLSAHPYNPVCPFSQGVSYYSSSSQHIVSSSGEVKYIRNSGQEMQIACDIVEEPSHIALYGSKNPYELTGLGVNISSISSTSSGMNLSTNSAKENNEYNQLKLQKQIDGYQRFEIGSGLNMDDADGDLTATGVPQKVQDGKNMPYQPVFTVLHGTSYSLSSLHLNKLNQLLEHPEYHSRLHCIQPSPQPIIKDVSTSMTLYVKEPCSQENFYLADNFPSLQGFDNVADNNPRMSVPHNTVVSARNARNQSPTMSGMVHADVLEIYYSLDQQTSANNIQIQYALQAARQPSQPFLHANVAETNSPFGHQFADNLLLRLQHNHQTYPYMGATTAAYGLDLLMELFKPSSSHITSNDVISGALPKINLQGGTMIGKDDLKHKNLHGQIGFHENVASHYFGMNPELPRISSFLHQKCSEFLQLNSDAMRCLTRVEKQVEQSTIIGPPFPSVIVPSPLSGNHLSSMSRGYCLGYKDPNNQGIGFSPMYEPSGFNTNYTLPLRMEAHAMESYDIDALSKATRQSCQRKQYRHLERHHKKIVASEAQALHSNVDTPIRMNKAKEFNEIVRDHEACFLSFYHPTPIPSHVLNMLHWCFGIDMERKMPLPRGIQHNAMVHQGLSSLIAAETLLSIHMHARLFPMCGSRFIQQKLQNATPEEKFMVFEEIMPDAIELVMDIYGNYVLQKWGSNQSPSVWCFNKNLGEDVRLIGDTDFLDIFEMYATEASFHLLVAVLEESMDVASAVELGDLDQKIQITTELNNDIMKCIHDQNANHVVQKCIEHAPPQFIQFFLEDMYGHVVELSVHPYGCCVVHHGKALVRSLIINIFIGKIVTMSKQKYASNVIEKSLVFGSYDETQKIINEVLTTADLVLVSDQYANYVVQKVIVTCDEWQRKIPEDAPQAAPQLHLCKACRCTDREAH
uniref:PUM-HD domain-containing protein n=1 Tax=Oryza rufipogon TaxID=4529 RepID=A0A0E0PKU0_ORYRU